MYPEPGSNRHRGEPTGVWDQRVYRFRHLGLLFLESGCKGTAFFWTDQIFCKKNYFLLHFSAKQLIRGTLQPIKSAPETPFRGFWYSFGYIHVVVFIIKFRHSEELHLRWVVKEVWLSAILWGNLPYVNSAVEKTNSNHNKTKVDCRVELKFSS